MKAKEKDGKDAAKVAEKVATLVAKAAAKTVKVEQQKVNPPENVVALIVGNSAEEIGESEENYEFSRVSVREHTEAKNWVRAAKPSSSTRKYGAEVDAALLGEVELGISFHFTRATSLASGVRERRRRASRSARRRARRERRCR
jgi:hypothetical protein